MEKLMEKYIHFPERMPVFILKQEAPLPTNIINHKIVEAIIYQQNQIISISHPAFTLKNTHLLAQYCLDAGLWYAHEDPAVLLLHVFVQIIKKHHGLFEVCHHRDNPFEELKHQSLRDANDYEQCLKHMINRLGLWEGVFGKSF